MATRCCDRIHNFTYCMHMFLDICQMNPNVLDISSIRCISPLPVLFTQQRERIPPIRAETAAGIAVNLLLEKCFGLFSMIKSFE